jgi:hypothetical protein
MPELAIFERPMIRIGNDLASNVTNTLVAVATPMRIIAPDGAGPDSMVWVVNNIQMMPASGRQGPRHRPCRQLVHA